jgi:FkbM family methyltransferase
MLRDHLPTWAVVALRGAERYLLRLAVWPILLGQVRGARIRDELVLVAGAIASPVFALRGLDRWQDPTIFWDAEVVVRGVGRFEVRGRSDDLFHVLPWRERAVVRAVRERLAPGDVFVDAGANIGFYTVLASRLVGPSGKVLAIEMMPDTAARLRRHCELNASDNVTVVERALSDGSVDECDVTVNEGAYGQARVVGGLPASSARGAGRVRCVTLDAVLEHEPHVALAKLDLEGAEGSALRGATLALPRISALVVEDLARGTTDELMVREALEAGGFRVTSLDATNLIAVARP